MSVTFILILFLKFDSAFNQGLNYSWLVGYYPPQYLKAKITFTPTTIDTLSELRNIPFIGSTQGNISNESGNILMSSNGYFVANASGDTMLNGSNINPNSFTSSEPNGLPLPYGNIFLPMPNDTTKFVLFHQTGNYNLAPIPYSTEIYSSIIDITHDGGLGEIISKNNIILSGIFGWGLSVCKHGNGRDWWIIALRDSGKVCENFLLTPDTIQYMGSQNLQVPGYEGWAGEPVFSPDGTKFAYIHGTPYPPTQYITNMRLLDFDRCDGTFSNPVVLNLPDSTVAFATAFSPNSKLLYVASPWNIYQLNVDSALTNPSLINVAVNDSFADPQPPFYTNFFLAYLAANGKIYYTTGNSTYYLHVMNSPDSIGIACDVQQHSIDIPCFHGQAVPNHPNYYLGRKIGSPCDSLTSISEIEHDFKFRIFPNPNNGNFSISYLPHQNKIGKLEIIDVNGKTVFKYNLPQWSTLQNFSLPKLSNGVYLVKINSGGNAVNKKLIVFQH